MDKSLHLQFEQLPDEDRRSFAETPKKVLLPGGTALYRGAAKEL